jgi:hypothetical protein
MIMMKMRQCNDNDEEFPILLWFVFTYLQPKTRITLDCLMGYEMKTCPLRLLLIILLIILLQLLLIIILRLFYECRILNPL